MALFGPVQRGGQIGRQRRFDLYALRSEGMHEGEPRCVKELPFEPEVAGHTVDGIAGYRQADRLEVHADLVRPPRLEPHAQQGSLAQDTLHLEVRDGIPWRRRVE